MYQIIYASRGGNTKKLAITIAEELDAQAQDIRLVPTLPKGVDLILGSGLYFLRPSKSVRDFIRNNDFQGRKVALFGTSATGVGIESIVMAQLLKRKGAIIIARYHCPGQFMFIRKGRPSIVDLANVRKFARSVKRLCFIQIDGGKESEQHEDRILSCV